MAKSAAASAPKSPAAKPRKGPDGPRRAVVLDGKQRRYLRGLAHDKHPILQIGKAGASRALLGELDRALETHELVKIRMLRECPTEPSEILGVTGISLGASVVGTVGNIAILYRERSDNPSINLPDMTARRAEVARPARTARSTKTGKPTTTAKTARGRPTSRHQ